MKPVIFGLSGPELTPDERAFFAESKPAGFILFKHNCETRAQMRALTDSLRDLTGRDDVPILIDQEGGRVARMQPPEWSEFPAGPAFDRLYGLAPSSAIEAARANGHALGLMLSEVGVNVDCLPLLDLALPDTTPAVASRALGSDPMRVAALGRATLDGLKSGGVVGVVKHMPGHGRARVDSHYELPVVVASDAELESDIAAFRTLNWAPMGITCHLMFTAWDAENPTSLSKTIIEQVIRGRIGFDGLLMTDDIDMKALSGTPGEKAARAVAAGCDLALACWARKGEMEEIASRLGEMGAKSRERLDTAMATVASGADGADMAELVAKRDELLALV